jgi:hypothetical protein
LEILILFIIFELKLIIKEEKMEESVWRSFFKESKQPVSSLEEFNHYTETYSSYVFQSPHVQENLELSKTPEEFLQRIKEFGELE